MATPARLLTLPLEVRFLIYHHLFASAVLRPFDQPRLRSKSAHKPDLETTAILATCRLCHLEALPVLFKTCAFKLMEINDKHIFLRNVPHHNTHLSNISSLTLAISSLTGLRGSSHVLSLR
jgi:hypothetical protein